MNQSPPKWANNLLTRFHPEDTLEEVEGDLEEFYAYWCKKYGEFWADIRYSLNVLTVLPPFVRRRKKQNHTQTLMNMLSDFLSTSLLKSNLKQFGRRIAREKTYAFLNIFGLSAGLTCFTFIALWVSDELSYDTFHTNYDRIVRITTTEKSETNVSQLARSGLPVAKALQQNYAEVENTVRMDIRGEIVQHDDKQTIEPYILLADPSFFQVFNYRLVRGNAATILKEPYTLLLTEMAAKKYFGSTDPIGKALKIFMYDSTGRGADYTITGIVADPPQNAHFTFSMISSFKTIEAARPNLLTAEGWRENRFFTYLLLKKGVDYEVLSDKISNFYQKQVGGKSNASQASYTYHLQALKDIHLKSHLERETRVNGDINKVYIFLSIGIFILLLAAINYTNLATARSAGRAKEISVKKVIGAVKTQLILHYLAESILFTLLALGMACLLSLFIQPFFYQLSGKDVSLFSSPLLLLFLVGVSVFLGILAGIYPAFVLSTFKPAVVLKGSFKSSAKGVMLRKSLVMSQFVITLLLVTSIVIMYAQMSYIKNKDLGYNKDALLFLRLNGNADVVSGFEAFKNELASSPLIGGITTFRSGIMNGIDAGPAETIDAKGKKVEINTAKILVDADYLSVYGVKLIAGKNFGINAGKDTIRKVILNESAVKKAGWHSPEDAIGKPFMMDNQAGMVIGVTKDFHFNSLQQTLMPLAIFPKEGYFSKVTVKLNGQNLSQGVSVVKAAWKKHFPVVMFDYDFVDTIIKEQYVASERFSSIILYFSLLSLIIACMGLYGLISYTTSQKTKEIGIRKVLGASVNSIVLLLSKDFLTLVVFASCIALPVAGYLMSQWLEDFAYRISFAWWMFMAPLALVLLVAAITVSFQAIKAAMIDPIKSLKIE
ncbi:ABC transporter permease [Emticicia sp. BO119]|uniref:ABC transporter permease n=1 Tax=Emticicia sp. BO119 TaxID=2757768 RepID=UPI0015F07FDB|nr:ABC transporter permease [Emticicia sp. BO119]MBA4852998.1 ABC transporter permease [Emticicia sp. BO119]